MERKYLESYLIWNANVTKHLHSLPLSIEDLCLAIDVAPMMKRYAGGIVLLPWKVG